jgi:hypothetical protein
MCDIIKPEWRHSTLYLQYPKQLLSYENLGQTQNASGHNIPHRHAEYL